MTAFVIVCAAMLAAALLWILVPLWRAPAASGEAPARDRQPIVSVAVGAAVVALAIGMYAHLSTWDWDTAQTQAAQMEEMDTALQQLEAKLAENPNDLDGWLLLGRSYTSIGRFPRAVDAFQQAYDISGGQSLEATTGLAEALFLTDQASLGGRAGQLFEAALKQAPNHPKALWYGAVAALQSGNLQLARDRLQLLLAQNPPPELQSVLQRQIDDLNAQLAEQGAAPSAAAQVAEGGAAADTRAIEVAVSLSPELQKQLSAPVPLFVLARDPAGGPPLAVQRLSSAALPATVQLSERDAMMPTRTIATVPRVQVVARLSKSGTPQAQSGDFFGEAEFEFGKDSGTLNIIIDRVVP